jgi:hypothetical protein
MTRLKKLLARVLGRLIRLLKRVQVRLQKPDLSMPVRDESDNLLQYPIEALPSLAGPQMIETETYKKLFYLLEERGIHVTPNHFYYPVPDLHQLLVIDPWKCESELPGIDMNIGTQLNFLSNIFPKYQDEYNTFPHHKQDDLLPHDFYFNNRFFDGPDAIVLYCMVRHYKPRQIIEVGSGWSTRISARAALLNGNTHLTSIEPYPAPVLVNGFPGLDLLIPKKVEDVDPAFFQTLDENDILFIDTSHIVKIGGDVNYLFLEILPRLKKGVVIHVHDIFFPQEYSKWFMVDLLRFFTEQYLLQAFLAFNTHFRVLFGNNMMYLKHLSEFQAAFPKCPFYHGSSSFWMEKIA